MVLENLCSGATRPRKKFDNIFVHFDTIPAVTDGHVAVAKTALAERRAGKQEAQLMLTTGSTRLAVSRGQQTWYHSTCYI